MIRTSTGAVAAATLVVVATLTVAPPPVVSSVAPQSVRLPEDPAKNVLQQMCTSCHDLEVLNGRRETPERWGEIVEDMFVRGAQGTPQQIDVVVAYLAKYFGKAPGAVPP
ncbi:MAG TPA: cytochrome c, partial [Vicinamibacterales bacterium]|nr:cytochrome c [Vicinamibacterales bacterium]